jgi:hypothetical protein
MVALHTAAPPMAVRRISAVAAGRRILPGMGARMSAPRIFAAVPDLPMDQVGQLRTQFSVGTPTRRDAILCSVATSPATGLI